MKKLLSTFLAICMAFAMTSTALAADTDTTKSPITVIAGTLTSDPPEPGITPRAVTEPTTYAPSSWYGVYHYWTATYYTWSSYKYTNSAGSFFYAVAEQSFDVQLYYGDGTSMGTYHADYQGNGKYLFNAVMSGSGGYYFRLINTSGTPITSDAYYIVSSSGS